MHLLGSLEGGNDFFRNRNRILGARVATHPCRMLAQRECSEATQFNPVAPGKPISNGVKDNIHDRFEIMSRQMRIVLGKLPDQFGLIHVGRILRCGVIPSGSCQSSGGPSSNYL